MTKVRCGDPDVYPTDQLAICVRAFVAPTASFWRILRLYGRTGRTPKEPRMPATSPEAVKDAVRKTYGAIAVTPAPIFSVMFFFAISSGARMTSCASWVSPSR